MRFPLGCFAALLLAGCFEPVCDSTRWECGGADAALSRDAGPADAGHPDTGPSPDAARDAGPADAGPAPDGGFCEGAEAKVQLRGAVTPVAVTGSQVFMNCCDGAELVFHTAPAFGANSELLLTAQGGFVMQTVSIGEDPKQPVSASLSIGASYFGSGISAAANRFSGTLTFSRAKPIETNPLLIRTCLTLRAPGDTLDGALLYAPAARVVPYGWAERFTVYLLADSTMDAATAAQRPLASLAREASPLLDLNSIRYYQQRDSFVALTLDAGPDRLTKRIGTIPVQGKPFVVVADGTPIYLGAFWAAVSSVSPPLPYIRVEKLTARGVAIELAPNRPDPRSDPRILSALTETGKLAP